MHFQSDGTQINVRPVPRPVVGVPGWVTGGDPLTGQAPSNDDVDVLNMLLDEMGAFLAAGGVAPDKLNNGQVLAVCRRLFAQRSEFAQGIANNGWVRLPGQLNGGRPKLVWGSDVALATNTTNATKDVYYADAFSQACFAVVSTAYTATYTYNGQDAVWAPVSASTIQTNRFRAVVDNLNFQAGTLPVVNRNVGFSYLVFGSDAPA